MFIAEYHDEVAGICSLVLNPTEGQWGGPGYPEIVDTLTEEIIELLIKVMAMVPKNSSKM